MLCKLLGYCIVWGNHRRMVCHALWRCACPKHTLLTIAAQNLMPLTLHSCTHLTSVESLILPGNFWECLFCKSVYARSMVDFRTRMLWAGYICTTITL